MVPARRGSNLTVGRLMIVIAAIAVGFAILPVPLSLIYVTFVATLTAFVALRKPLPPEMWTSLFVLHAIWLTLLLLAAQRIW